MIVFRGCGKCGGDLYVERDILDAELVCLQCGYRRTVNTSRLGTAREAERELIATQR
jgi:hypothetical protein